MDLSFSSFILWFSLVMVGFVKTQHTPFTQMDSYVHNFILDEIRLWDSINSHSNISSDMRIRALEDVYYFFKIELNYSYGKIETVRPFSARLVDLIQQSNDTRRIAVDLLANKKYELKEFAEHWIQRLPGLIAQIFDETKQRSFLEYIRQKSDYCQTTKIRDHTHLHNVIADFYSTVIEGVLRSYMVTQMSYMLLAINGYLSRYQKNSADLRTSFESHYRTLESNVQTIAKQFSGEIWACDNYTQYDNGNATDTYTQITNFMQGYIENEVNFNRDGSCADSCPDYEFTRLHSCKNGTACKINYLDSQKTRCDGEIRNCTFIESDMSMCTNENDNITSRRYNYVRYSSGTLLGRGQFCPEEVKLKSWTRWFVHCSFCFCYCDHRANSDRYFSLREAVSDISSNKVVTGIRLLKFNRIIHLFITERTLRRNGQVDNDGPVSWTGDYKFDIQDYGVETDYFALTWMNRKIELDTIYVPNDHFVTGVRFRAVRGNLRFEVRSTPYEHETGLLSQERYRTTWRGNNNWDKRKIPVEDLDVPTRAPTSSIRWKGSDFYVEFTPTDIYKDVAQTTVPFIDTQPVESMPPRPLTGAGIYFKSSPGYGGFIGPMIAVDPVNYKK